MITCGWLIRTGGIAGMLALVWGWCGATADDFPLINPSLAAAGTVPSGTQAKAKEDLLPGGPTEQDYSHLHNLLQVTGRIYTGGEPSGDQAFAQLAELGVRTIVSVDGARPDLEAAERHGLRYVHIPIGYDGISDRAGKSLAQLVKEAEGPFYIHCHHGKHRGPAGAAIACIADGAADSDAARAVLEEAGTSKGYAGLWRDVQAFAAPANDEPLPELVPVAEVDSLAAAMAQIDRASDNLKLCQSVNWRSPAEHPDLVPAQESLLLREAFHETVRQLKESNEDDQSFLEWMKKSETTAAALQSAFERGDTGSAAKAFASMQNQCKRCHLKYRD